MSKVWYGSLSNRLEENKNFLGRDIQVGDSVIEYSWSDRDSYYITEVIDSNHFKMKKWHHIADADKELGMGHQDWLFFKTYKEYSDYYNTHFAKKIEYNPEMENGEIEIKFVRGNWCSVVVYNKEWIDAIDEEWHKWHIYNNLTEKEQEKVKAGKSVTKYRKFGNISFAKEPDYYFDWEF